jgi:hypothetical protein
MWVYRSGNLRNGNGGKMDVQVASPRESDDDPEIVMGVVVDDEDQMIRDAVAILSSASASNGGATSPQFMEQVRAEVLQLFAQVDASPELPSIIAGIGNLYENGYDAAAEHMEMAHWGLPHRLQSAR